MKTKTKRIILYLFAAVFTASLFFIHQKPVSALTMSDINYILRLSDMNTLSGKSKNSAYSLNQAAGENAPGVSKNTQNVVQAGFSFIAGRKLFRFTVSQPFIDFGPLSPTTPVIRTAALEISTGAASGYTVVGYEDHPLKDNKSGATIPDTTCDNGSCTETQAAQWANILTYGFGYNCENAQRNDCVGFSEQSDFKQFSDRSSKENPATIMTGTTTNTTSKITITYKLNISGTQEAGLYNNTITYIAAPTL